MLSIALNGIAVTSTKLRSPSSLSGYATMRSLSIRVSVSPTVRPRSAIPDAPAAKASVKP